MAPRLMPSLLHLLNRGARCLLPIRAIFRLWRSMRRAWQSCGSDTIRSVLWKRGDERWQAHIVDTTELSVFEVAQRVATWARQRLTLG